MRSRLSHVHHQLTTAHTSATNLYNYTTRAPQHQQQQPFNSGKRGLRGTGYPLPRRVSKRPGPSASECDYTISHTQRERALRSRKLGHFHHFTQLGLALLSTRSPETRPASLVTSAFSKVVGVSAGSVYVFFRGGPEYDITSLACACGKWHNQLR